MLIDKIWDTMWSGGISNPISVIEQLDGIDMLLHGVEIAGNEYDQPKVILERLAGLEKEITMGQKELEKMVR